MAKEHPPRLGAWGMVCPWCRRAVEVVPCPRPFLPIHQSRAGDRICPGFHRTVHEARTEAHARALRIPLPADDHPGWDRLLCDLAEPLPALKGTQ